MIVAGDFNSVPGSAAHSLLISGAVDPAHPELHNDPLGILRPPSRLQHQLPLASAYAALSSGGGGGPVLQQQRRRMDAQHHEPRLTNVGRDFQVCAAAKSACVCSLSQGTLDYVLYTTDSLQPVAVLELPDEGELRKSTGLPNEAWSSDHVALMAEFAVLGK